MSDLPNEAVKPLCSWCRNDISDSKSYRMKVFFWDVHLCPQCYILSKQLFSNAVLIREELFKRGIYIGVPKQR